MGRAFLDFVKLMMNFWIYLKKPAQFHVVDSAIRFRLGQGIGQGQKVGQGTES